MKARTRLIYIMMVAAMIFCGMTFTSMASSSPKGKVQVTITQDYAASQTILKEMNKQRKKRNLKPLKMDKSMSNAAVQRAAEITIAIPTTHPHNRPDGRLARTAHKNAIYEICAETTGYTPYMVVNDGWMTSKPHKKGILLKNARSCGVAAVTASNGAKYFVVIFSDKKVSKVQKSAKKVTLTKTVVVKSKMLKRKYFKASFHTPYTFKDMEVFVGRTGQLSFTYSGPDTIYTTGILPQSFTWTSSDKSIATVGKSGLIKGIKEGTVTITGKIKGTASLTFMYKIRITHHPYTAAEYYDVLRDYVLTHGSSDNNGSICCVLGTEGSKESQLTTYMLLVPDDNSEIYTNEPCVEFRAYTQNYLNGEPTDFYYTSWIFEDIFKTDNVFVIEHYYETVIDGEKCWYLVSTMEYGYSFDADNLDWITNNYYTVAPDYDKADAHLKATMRKWDTLLGDKIPDFSMYNMEILSLK